MARRLREWRVLALVAVITALSLVVSIWGGARADSVVESVSGVPVPARFALVANPPIRVALKTDFDQLTVEESLYGAKILVQYLGGQIRLAAPSGAEVASANGFRLEPAPGRLIRLEGVTYRGCLDVFINPFGNSVLVNELHLEDYLRGVVANELSPKVFPFIEALKAQSVAARTYAAGELGRKARFGFDLFADERSQVYKGLASEQLGSDRAVEETAGRVAVYEGRPITAFYSSTCGGTTANYADIFPARRSLGEGGADQPGTGEKRPEIPYLKGGIVCPDEASPYAHWTVRVTPPTIRPLLDRYAGVGPLKNLKIERRDGAGRVLEMLFVGGSFSRLLKGNDLRFALGLRSNFITKLTIRRDGEGYISSVDVDGRGFGHGVGMCQFGAVEWARRGRTADWILRRYYPGVELFKAY